MLGTCSGTFAICLGDFRRPICVFYNAYIPTGINKPNQVLLKHGVSKQAWIGSPGGGAATGGLKSLNEQVVYRLCAGWLKKMQVSAKFQK